MGVVHTLFSPFIMQKSNRYGKKRLLVLNGGGDCPGLNAVIRGIVKRSQQEKDWEVYGSLEAFNGVLNDPIEIIKLTPSVVAGIHVRGGTILKTTNKGGPFNWPVQQKDGSWTSVDRSDEMIAKIKDLGFTAVINMGGDGSQRISQALFQKGLPVIGVPKTIDNDLSATDTTFGFRTAVQICTESFDKLVTTAESHHRVILMEVMGRDAGWIALHTAIAGGAEICIIPEIPYDVKKIVKSINKRYKGGKGFVNIVISEGAKNKDGDVVASKATEVGYENRRLGGCAWRLAQELKDEGLEADVRETVLGHVQRGGTPIAYDRLLATVFGVKAFELVLQEQYGMMVAFKDGDVTSVSLLEASRANNFVDPENSYLVKAARGLGITFGD